MVILYSLYVSPTLDTSVEHNTLMETVYPKLKIFCQKKGFEFQVVDMRWGVRDEATDDHMTTELCMKEIYACQRLSTGPNFIVSIDVLYIMSQLASSVVKMAELCNIWQKLCNTSCMTTHFLCEVLRNSTFFDIQLPRHIYTVFYTSCISFFWRLQCYQN